MLDLEVIPENSIGNEDWKFLIGMPFQQVVEILRRHDSTIRNVQVLYSDKIPLHMNLEINLSNDGIKLVFEPKSQRLQQIEIFDLSKLKLRYYGTYFNDPSNILATIDQIYQTFTCTTPGERNNDYYVLHYRGISFSFLTLSAMDSHQQIRSSNIPSGFCPIVSKINIYYGNSINDCRNPLSLPLQCYHGAVYLERLDVRRDSLEGVREFHFEIMSEALYHTKTGEPERETMRCSIQFGDTAQDIMSALGSPNHIFYKAEDKMKIHSPDGNRRIRSRKADYFLNYFTLGMDCLFDANTHRMKKVVLHTNYPGHYNFNTYYRCNFNLPIFKQRCSSNALMAACQVGSGSFTDDENTAPPSTDLSTLNVTPFTKWETIQEFLNKSVYIQDSPVILKRNSAANVSNPFGPTYCYGFGDTIFEVIPSCNLLASVTICSTQNLSGVSKF